MLEHAGFVGEKFPEIVHVLDLARRFDVVEHRLNSFSSLLISYWFH
jgi:hypothetical protein